MTSGDAVEDGVLRLRDGRELGYARYGRQDGEPIFYFHGHPGSRLEARFAQPVAAAAGLLVVALDRPGYGLSTVKPGRAITDWPAEVAEAADQFGFSRFFVAGASGGGPYALACAWRLPRRVIRAAVMSGAGPFQAPGVTHGMRWQNRLPARRPLTRHGKGADAIDAPECDQPSRAHDRCTRPGDVAR